MTAARLLLVDDEPQLIRALLPALMAAGYQVDTAETAAEGLSAIANRAYDAVILDLGLPDMDGKSVIAEVRGWSHVPIVVLSAHAAEQEKIVALDMGADDFVAKPFPVGELLARIRAALRGRERRVQDSGVMTIGEISINVPLRSAIIAGEDVRLTQREFEFLSTLARNRGKIVGHKQMIAAVWGASGNADAQSVRVLAAQVRNKLEPLPSSAKVIVTEPGLGYRLAD